MPASLTTVKKFFPKVKSITDSRKNIKIEVTKGDANSKAVKQHDACAFAVACKRALHLDGTIISRTVAYLIKGDKAIRYKLHLIGEVSLLLASIIWKQYRSRID